MERFETFVDPTDGTEWRVDVGFLRSNWTCVWGAGCAGIGDEPAPELNHGCCSVGAELLDGDEALRIGALGAALDPAIFEHADTAERDGVFADGSHTATRVVDGACIFHNRRGFSGGEGCALHLAALADGEHPLEYKPAICWQMPLRVDHGGGDAVRTLRTARRADWGDGAIMAWWCTSTAESDRAIADAYCGDQPAGRTLAREIEALVGPEIAVELQRRLDS